MRKRSTIEVKAVLALVNNFNEKSTVSAEWRHGQNHMLEEILHATGNYHGYIFLGENRVPVGQLAGQVSLPLVEGQPQQFVFPDESRRRYLGCGW